MRAARAPADRPGLAALDRGGGQRPAPVGRLAGGAEATVAGARAPAAPLVGGDVLGRALARARLAGRPAPDQGGEARVVGRELVHAEQVDAAAGHRGGGLLGDAVVGRSRADDAATLGDVRRVLEVADQLGGVVRALVVGPAVREVLVADRARLLVGVAPVVGDRGPGGAL